MLISYVHNISWKLDMYIPRFHVMVAYYTTFFNPAGGKLFRNGRYTTTSNQGDVFIARHNM